MRDWPKPRQLHNHLPPVEHLASEMLPPMLRTVAEDLAERMQIPLDYPAVVIMLSLAGAVNRRACIQPKVHDSSWQVVPNLWGGIVAPPGFMKTPIIGEVTRPLTRIEDEWHNEFKRALAACDEIGDKPIRKRLIVNDATHPKLHEILRDNPAGVLVVRDELTGWIAELDAAGREGERAFYLTAWNGNTSHDVDRIRRGSIHASACCLSLIGGIQPERLRKYMRDAGDRNIIDDGLIQRLQLLAWPDFDPEYTYVDRRPNDEAQQRLERLYIEIAKRDATRPLKFRFSKQAQCLFVSWFEMLEGRIRSGELTPVLSGHLGKYRSLMPSLATLFEIGSGSFEGFGGSRNEVTVANAERAIAWCKYLESHARRVYALVPSEHTAAVDLAAKIWNRAIGIDRLFTVRDVSQHDWRGLKSPEQVRRATNLLLEAGWIRDATQPVGVQGGRPSRRFEINPLVWNLQNPQNLP